MSVLYFILLICAAALAAYCLREFHARLRNYRRREDAYLASLEVAIDRHSENLTFESLVRRNSWQGLKRFKVVRKVVETQREVDDKQISDISSFYLEPLETPLPLPGFLPGQHISLELDTPDGPLLRYYSLSDAPNGQHFRVSVRRALAPPHLQGSVADGKGSSFLHDSIEEGTEVNVGMPSGDFCLQTDIDVATPVVLLSGGIGITPMLSMAKTLVQTQPKRRVLMFCGIRAALELPMRADIDFIAEKLANVDIYICMSAPDGSVPELQPRENVHIVTGFQDGRVIEGSDGVGCWLSIELIKEIVGDDGGQDFFLCGPPPMMRALVDGLYFWGQPREKVHWEGFGPCAVNWPGDIINSKLRPCAVSFIDPGKGNSRVYLDWRPASGTILDLADSELEKVRKLKRMCGKGFCGECKTTYKGTVVYDKPPVYGPLKENECLTCCCRPDGDIVVTVNA